MLVLVALNLLIENAITPSLNLVPFALSIVVVATIEPTSFFNSNFFQVAPPSVIAVTSLLASVYAVTDARSRRYNSSNPPTLSEQSRAIPDDIKQLTIFSFKNGGD
jgi:hypothetical protein